MNTNKQLPLTQADWDLFQMSQDGMSYVDIAAAVGSTLGHIRYRIRRCQMEAGVEVVPLTDEERKAMAEGEARWSAVVNRSKKEVLLGLPPEGYSALSQRMIEEERRRRSIADEFALPPIPRCREGGYTSRGEMTVSDLRMRIDAR